MRESCVIKSNSYGINLILDGEIDFETLVHDICVKFAESKDFFGEATLVVSFEGRELTGEEVAVIIEAIELNSDIRILLVKERSELKDRDMYERIERFHMDKVYETARIIPDSVRENETVESENGIVVIGDIRRGATVRSAGNVIVFGRIEGEVYAGCAGDDRCYVVAEEYADGGIYIADVTDTVKAPHKGLFKRKDATSDALVFAVFDGKLICDTFANGLFKDIRDRL